MGRRQCQRDFVARYVAAWQSRDGTSRTISLHIFLRTLICSAKGPHFFSSVPYAPNWSRRRDGKCWGGKFFSKQRTTRFGMMGCTSSSPSTITSTHWTSFCTLPCLLHATESPFRLLLNVRLNACWKLSAL